VRGLVVAVVYFCVVVLFGFSLRSFARRVLEAIDDIKAIRKKLEETDV